MKMIFSKYKKPTEPGLYWIQYRHEEHTPGRGISVRYVRDPENHNHSEVLWGDRIDEFDVTHDPAIGDRIYAYGEAFEVVDVDAGMPVVVMDGDHCPIEGHWEPIAQPKFKPGDIINVAAHHNINPLRVTGILFKGGPANGRWLYRVTVFPVSRNDQGEWTDLRDGGPWVKVGNWNPF